VIVYATLCIGSPALVFKKNGRKPHVPRLRFRLTVLGQYAIHHRTHCQIFDFVDQRAIGALTDLANFVRHAACVLRPRPERSERMTREIGLVIGVSSFSVQ
jgi:hypothetical protein